MKTLGLLPKDLGGLHENSFDTKLAQAFDGDGGDFEMRVRLDKGVNPSVCLP